MKKKKKNNDEQEQKFFLQLFHLIQSIYLFVKKWPRLVFIPRMGFYFLLSRS